MTFDSKDLQVQTLRMTLVLKLNLLVSFMPRDCIALGMNSSKVVHHVIEYLDVIKKHL